jgi:dTDP-4-amino-4,6-dideoxygalactose transaminase
VYAVRFDHPRQRASTAEALHGAGIASRRYFDPIHLHPYFTSRFGYQPGDFPNAERLADTCLALPFASTMTEPTVDRVCAALRASMLG